MSFLSFFRYYLWYFRNPPWDSGISPPELLEYLKTRNSVGRALDMGCGTGTNVITLTKLGWQTDGVDFIPQAIARARKKCAEAGVNAVFRLGDVTDLKEFKGHYDLVLDLGCFHSLSRQEMSGYLCQLDRLMVPGSTWFLYTFLLKPGRVPAGEFSIPGLEQIAKRFLLRTRLDGFDRGERHSAYLIFEKI